VGKIGNAYNILVGNPEGKKPVGQRKLLNGLILLNCISRKYLLEIL
jgi:hypothetical protein